MSRRRAKPPSSQQELPLQAPEPAPLQAWMDRVRRHVRLCSGGTWLIRGVEIGLSVVEGEVWIAARPEFERTTWHRWLVGAVWSALRER